MKTAAATNAAQPQSRCHWYQFGLRTLLILVTFVGCSLGWLGIKVQEGRRQQAAVAAIEKSHGEVIYDYGWQFGSPLPGPAWLHSLLGADFFRTVVEVDLGGIYANDSDLKYLTVLSHVKKLRLESRLFTDAGLEVLKRLTHLEVLDLEGTPVTDVGLNHLVELKQLETIALSRTNVTGVGLDSLKKLTQLKVLYLYNTPLTDAGLEHVGDLAQLQGLDLNLTHVTDAGLEHLQSLKQLHWLGLNDTDVTAVGIAKLQKALPDCNIMR